MHDADNQSNAWHGHENTLKTRSTPLQAHLHSRDDEEYPDQSQRIDQKLLAKETALETKSEEAYKAVKLMKH